MPPLTDLKQRLEAAGLTAEAVAAALGPVPNRESSFVHLRLRGDGTRAGLIRLFVFGETVSADELPVAAEELAAAGLAELEGGAVRSTMRLSPHEGLLIAHDGEEELRDADYVG